LSRNNNLLAIKGLKEGLKWPFIINKNLKKFNDEELIIQFKEGNSLAFELLVKRHKTKIYQFILYQIKLNSADAEDLTQDVFIELFNKPNHYRGESQFLTFLYSIARNIVLNYFRSNKRKFTHVTEEISEEIMSEQCLLEDLSSSQWKEHYIKAFNLLSLDEKQILYFCDNEQLTYQEISEILGIKLGTVRSRINTVRNKMISSLQENKDEL